MTSETKELIEVLKLVVAKLDFIALMIFISACMRACLNK
jgi:hypothetical protein